MKVKEVLELLKKRGWYISRTRGSHRQLKNDRMTGTVTLAGAMNSDVRPKTLSRIRQQAHLSK
ncbi:addiction module toxin, HicA family [Aphanothece hegewaldii CCALA 016]|uniref:Addiction module toxin, HicA family n=1 Tax=Aphanothece hegewaldii CCALA 016 TaxID=2107694 RepID=A0A2T1LQK9_9CHRO|nr:type II toxin-antitoxin system HicA family toxin [Aphanothece hegewaldii]PSF28547.1 addiction module toxin, HicA family [Aphanothece hegewaldii CCALA 016]